MSDRHQHEYLFHQFQYDRFDRQLVLLQLQQMTYGGVPGYQKEKSELTDECLVQLKVCRMRMAHLLEQLQI